MSKSSYSFSITPEDMQIEQLGVPRIDSPIAPHVGGNVLDDSERVLYDDVINGVETIDTAAQVSMERAGPRGHIYFDPSKVRAGIVTCGGLCPGLNAVIRAVVMGLWHVYGVRHIVGFRYGYEGFIAHHGHDILDLNPDVVDGWQDQGGTKLGSSRGEQDTVEIVDCLERLGISQLYTVGGDGTLRGARVIAEEIAKRGLRIAVIGIPKTIDNDIPFIDESFGFQTAVSAAVQSLACAHVESKGVNNGVGLVKLMGRHSGFIACYAALAMSDVNFVLIPEVPFTLEGEDGFLRSLKRRLETRKHAVVVIAEGAGQDLLPKTDARDASGNVKLQDVGVYLRDQMVAFFKREKFDGTVKYIDPSYIVRSVAPNSHDNIYCLQLGHDAVHAAMAGKTAMLVGRWHGLNVHIPIQSIAIGRKRVDPERPLWRSVLESTGQNKWAKA
mgnify:CR=1 FL=1